MFRMLTSSTALSLVFLATGAVADVTPEDVWDSWQALSTSAGQELTVGGTARNGDSLEVSDVILTFKDDLGGSFSATIGTLTFKDNGDGTVAVTMPDTYPMTMAFPDGSEGPSSLGLQVTQPGLVITASGTASETDYAFTAPTVSVSLTEITDETGAKVDLQGDLVLTEVASAYKVARTGEQTAFESTFSAKALALSVSGKDTGGAGSGTLSMTDLAGTSNGTLLGADIMRNMAAALNSGFTTDADFKFATMAASVEVTEETGPTRFSATSQAGGLTLALNKASVSYGTFLNGLNMSMSGPDIPFPEVSVSLSEYAFNVLMPVSKSDTPQDFAFLTKLVDLTVSEDVWGLVDPGAVLSREPASFIVDVKGKGFWKQDIMDPAVNIDQIEAPGELTSLTIGQILAKAAGTEVSATGELGFDNADTVSFQGVPAPTGSITIDIKGVNALIDNLIKMGFITTDDAFGVRMMMGMYTRPGAGGDQVTSLIEFKDGGVFANGQPLQ